MKKLATSLLAAAVMGLAATAPVQAVEVSGVKLEDTAKVGGKGLVLCCAGVRVKVPFNV